MVFLFAENCRLAIFCAISIPCALYDITHLMVPRMPLFIMILLLTATSPSPYTFISCISGLVAFYSARIISRGKLGLADVWFAGSIGALGGLQLLVATTMCAILLVMPYSRGKSVPFIPPMLIGTLYIIFIHYFLGI